MTADNKFTRHLYQLEPNECKYSLYKLHFVLNGNNTLTEIVKIEPDRKFNKATGFDNWLVLKNKKHWNKCKCKTGLRPLKKKNCFYGDLVKTQPNGGICRSLVFAQFSNDKKIMVVDYFKGLDPANDALRFNLFQNHKSYF